MHHVAQRRFEFHNTRELVVGFLGFASVCLVVVARPLWKHGMSCFGGFVFLFKIHLGP